MTKAVHVRQARQVAQRDRLIREQRARQQGQRGVLGAGDGKAAAELIAAAYLNAVHRLGLNANCVWRKARAIIAVNATVLPGIRSRNIYTFGSLKLIEFSARPANAAKRRKGRFATVTTNLIKGAVGGDRLFRGQARKACALVRRGKERADQTGGKSAQDKARGHDPARQ